MYLGYYGLNKAPFHVTPDPEFLFPSPSHKEACAALTYGIAQRKGFIALTGEVGTGKTTVLRAYLKQAQSDALRTIYVFDPAQTYDDLLRLLMDELGGNPKGKNPAQITAWLHKTLVREHEAGRNIALIIDEAQHMPVDTLEQLRLLSNIETVSEKLIQIVLVGQPELDDKLNLHGLRQLKQRVAVRATVQSLSRRECMAYLQHRLGQAGGNYTAIFTPGALKRIVSHAKGNPRTMNIVADNALLAGFGAEQRPVGAGLVGEVIRDLSPSAARRWPRMAIAATAAAVIVILGLANVNHSPSPVDPADSVMALVEDKAAPEPLHNTVTKAPVPAEASVRIAGPEAAAPPPPALKSAHVTDIIDPLFPIEMSQVAMTPPTLHEAKAPKVEAVPPPEIKQLPLAQQNITVMVQPGDSLSRLIARVYGRSTPELMKRVRAHNPDLENPHRIFAGNMLTFPSREVIEASPSTGEALLEGDGEE